MPARLILLLATALLLACQQQGPSATPATDADGPTVDASCERDDCPRSGANCAKCASEPEANVADRAETAGRSVIRIRSTRQSWSHGQPWERTPANRRRGLGALIGPATVLTTAEMAADATFIEFESIDGTRTATAKVEAVDYEANLALIGLADTDADGDFFADMEVLELAEDPAIGGSLEIVQVEDNGRTLLTSGTFRSVDIVSSFLPGQFFLTYELKASMQSAVSSFTLPVLSNGQIAGILTSYNSKDQISDVIATPIIRHFLKLAETDEYTGFPSLGIATTRTDDPAFRAWLGLPESTGGIYVSKVRRDSAAATAGIEKGDVILSIDDDAVDRRGYFEDPHYGPLFWSHLIRGTKAAGDSVTLGIWRDGKPATVEATLEHRQRNQELVPYHRFGQAPPYLVKGGFLFQELSQPLLQAFGKEWESKAPLNLLDMLLNPEDHDEHRNRVVFLSGVIATPATIGYERLRNLVVAKVNGKTIEDMKSLIAAFDQPADGLHSIQFEDEDFTVYLDELACGAVDEQLIMRGISRLSRAE